MASSVEGMVISRRRVLPVGGSRAVTLSKKWLDIQKWLGKEVDEVISVANSIVILVDPEMKDEAISFLREWEARKQAFEAIEHSEEDKDGI